MKVDEDTIRSRLSSLSATREATDSGTGRRIVRAASELFVERGFRQTSMAGIARRAGIARATLYLHVSTKVDALLMAVAAERLVQLEAYLPVFDLTRDPRERLRLLIRNLVEQSAASPLLARVADPDSDCHRAFEELEPSRRAELTATDQAIHESLVDSFAPGRWTAAELTHRANLLRLMSYVGPRFADPRLRGDSSLETMSALLSDVFVDGFI